MKINGEKPWPLNKIKLIFDKESYLKEKVISLQPQKPGEKEKYQIILKRLGKLKVGEYKCILSFGVGLKSLKYFGETIILRINVKEQVIGIFRNEFGLKEKDYSDEKYLRF